MTRRRKALRHFASSQRPEARDATTESIRVAAILAERGYLLGRRIGKGSYAKVKIAERVKDNHIVAVKIMCRLKASREFDRFLPRELSIMAFVRHPNIIRVFEVIQMKQTICLITEYAERGDLLVYIKHRVYLTESEACNIFQQICQAMVYLHDNCICHRDLKCENVLLRGNGSVALTDFGFSKKIDPLNVLSNTHCGSTAYASPELIRGKPYNPYLSDVWSLGCILFILVTGRMPFRDTDNKKRIHRQISGSVIYPTRTVHVSPPCKDLVSHILEPNTERRYSLRQLFDHQWMSLVRGKAGNEEVKTAPRTGIAFSCVRDNDTTDDIRPAVTSLLKSVCDSKKLTMDPELPQTSTFNDAANVYITNDGLDGVEENSDFFGGRGQQNDGNIHTSSRRGYNEDGIRSRVQIKDKSSSKETKCISSKDDSSESLDEFVSCTDKICEKMESSVQSHLDSNSVQVQNNFGKPSSSTQNKNNINKSIEHDRSRSSESKNVSVKLNQQSRASEFNKFNHTKYSPDQTSHQSPVTEQIHTEVREDIDNRMFLETSLYNGNPQIKQSGKSTVSPAMSVNMDSSTSFSTDSSPLVKNHKISSPTSTSKTVNESSLFTSIDLNDMKSKLEAILAPISPNVSIKFHRNKNQDIQRPRTLEKNHQDSGSSQAKDNDKFVGSQQFLLQELKKLPNGSESRQRNIVKNKTNAPNHVKHNADSGSESDEQSYVIEESLVAQRRRIFESRHAETTMKK